MSSGRKMLYTERAGELSVDDDVGVSPDGGGEVGVARDIESIVSELCFLLHCPSAEIPSQLKCKGDMMYNTVAVETFQGENIFSQFEHHLHLCKILCVEINLYSIL